MPTYTVTAYQWAGFTTYPTSFELTVDDDDAQLDWFGGDTGTAQTATFGGSTYTINGAGLLPSNIQDNDGGGGTSSEELLFMSLNGYGWVFVPMPGSAFSEGDQILGWTTGTWSDTDGVEHSSVICFTGGSKVSTPFGDRKIEDLVIGDLVLTKDNGPRPIKWIGARTVSSAELVIHPKLRPVIIPRNCFGPGVPNDDIQLSRQHRILIERQNLKNLFGQSEMLLPAIGLEKASKAQIDGSCVAVTYFHVLFDDHQIITCDGLQSESFYPGTFGVSCMADKARAEMFNLFPDLCGNLDSYGPPARSVLKPKHGLQVFS
ncbi:Hint domain-containing protein [Aliiroseovarius sp. 2305UL8-7]|uniref:Hint domain-containing protein n=1 Tax=Aliiroseovarius conchicola TaxID=3121637 RepID=UPI003526CEFE